MEKNPTYTVALIRDYLKDLTPGAVSALGKAAGV